MKSIGTDTAGHCDQVSDSLEHLRSTVSESQSAIKMGMSTKVNSSVTLTEKKKKKSS